jgi:hypothetical protein
MLRRSFCKNWFNARWRDLLFAFVGMVASGGPEIQLPLGEDSSAILGVEPILLSSPVRIPSEFDQPVRKGETIEGDIDDDDGLARDDDPHFQSEEFEDENYDDPGETG